MSEQDDDYTVGYKKPPKTHQFKKGQPSRNPKGRPIGSRNMGILLDRELDKQAWVTENGKRTLKPCREIIAQRIAVNAMNGSERALDRIHKIYERHFKTDHLAKKANQSLEAYFDSLTTEELEEIMVMLEKATKENKDISIKQMLNRKK